jgi:hypothetical protein
MSSSSRSKINQKGSFFAGNVNTTGGDNSTFNIGNTTQNIYEQQKPDFFKPNLEQFQSLNLKISLSLIETIHENRLLILGGSSDVDKESLAKHIAWFISDAQKLVVKEWRRSSDSQSIDIELQNADESTVFLLTDVTPQNIFGYALLQFQKVAVSKKHYVIVTTDTPLTVWRSEPIKSFWHELSFDDVADANNLENTFTEQAIRDWYYTKLSSREQLLTLGLCLFDGLYDDQFFAALEVVVEGAWQQRDASLHALDYCDLDNLRNFFDFDDKDGQRIFVKIKFPKRRQLLFRVAWKSHRRQILSALPILVDLTKNLVKRYEISGTSIRRNQFHLVISETISDIGLIDIDAVQDTLISMSADKDIEVQAVAARAMALWRDDKKREFVIESSSSNLIDQKLFDTLQYWQNEASIRSLVNNILKDKDQEKTNNPEDYIRATIALTVGAASLYDPPDDLSPELCELLKQLMSDRNQLVRDRVFLFTLPKVIQQHLLQLRTLLHSQLSEISENSSTSENKDINSTKGIWGLSFLSVEQKRDLDIPLIFAVAGSLALAYQGRPNDVLETLNLWSVECQDKRPSRINIANVTSREALLSTVAITYGEIECDRRAGLLTTQQVFTKLNNILVEELHPRVREATLFAIGRQAYNNFERVVPQLQDIVSIISKEERHKISEILTEIYLDQRTKLSGGEDFIEVNGKKYPVWINSTRHPTPVEEVMLIWAKNDQNAMAQEVATRASANFAIQLDQEEERQIKRLREGSGSSEVARKPIYANPIEVGKPPKDWYLGKLIPWLATRNAEGYRTSIRNLLPEGLRQIRISRDVMEFVLRKWVNTSDDDVKTISGRLKPGLWLAENLGWFIALGIGSTLTLVWLAATNLSQVRKTEPIIQIIEPSDPNIIIVSDRIVVEVSDTTSFNTGNLTIKISEGATPDDYLGIRNQGRNSGEIGVNGSEVTYGGTVIGLFKGGSLKEPLVISFNSNAKLPVVQALLQNITYKNTATTLSEGSRKVEFQITDEAGKVSQLLSRTVFVTHDNIDPTLIIPESLAANENEPIKVSGITISDSDSTKKLTVTLSVSNGFITVNSIPKGIVVSDISDNNTKTVKFIGSLDKIKATLADASAITYKGTDDDNFKVTVNDGGQDVPGDPTTTLVWPPKAKDAKTVSKDIKISVALKNKPPVITIPEPSKTIDENKELIISGIGIDDDTKDLTVTLSAEHGTVTVKPDVAKGVVIDNISNNKTKKVVITGELAKIKSTLSDTQAIVYKGDQDFSGNDSLTIVVDDKGRGKTDKLSIIVNRIKRPPILKFLTDIATATPPSLPVPSPDVTEIKISKQEALDAVQNYLQAKGSIFAPPFSREIAAKVSTGTLYLDITKSEGSIDSLIKNQQFYRYGAREVKVLDYFTSDSSKAFIDLIITEEAARFKNGNLELAPSVSTKKYRYELRKDNNILKVFDYKD